MKKDKNQIKKPSSILSGMFKYFTLFIFVALFSFFGAIELLSPSTLSQLEENGSNAEEGYSMSDFVISLLATQNVDAEFSLSFVGANSAGVSATSSDSKSLSDMSISVDGRIVYAEDGLFLDLAVVLDGSEISLKIGYTNDTVYVIRDDVTYAFDITSFASGAIVESSDEDGEQGAVVEVESQSEEETDNETEVADGSEETSDETTDFGTVLSSIFEYVTTEVLELDTDQMLEELSAFLGIDFDNFSLDDFVTEIMASPAEETEDGCKITISIGTFLKILINCDENYNIISIKTNSVLVQNNSFKFTADVSAMNDVNMETGAKTTVELPFEVVGDQIVDLSGLGLYAKYAQNWFESADVVTAKLLVGDDGFDADFVYDGTTACLSTTISDIEVALFANESTCFAQVGDLKFKFSYSAYSAIKSSIDEILNTEFGSLVAEKIEELIDEFEAGAENSSEQNYSAESLLQELILGTYDVSNFAPTSAILTENSYQLIFADFATLTLSSENQILTSLSLVVGSDAIDVTFGITESGVVLDETAFYDADVLLSLFSDLSLDIATAGGLSCTIEYGNYTFLLEADLIESCVKISGEILGLDLAIYVCANEDSFDTWQVTFTILTEEVTEENETTTCETVLFVTTVGELKSISSQLKTWIASFSTSSDDPDATEENITYDDIISALQTALEVASEILLSDSETEILVLQCLGVDLSLCYDGSVATTTVVYNNKTITVSMQAKTPDFEVPSTTASATDLQSLANFVTADEYKFDFSLEYNNNTNIGLVAEGSFVYSDGIFELVLEGNADIDLVVRFENGLWYAFYGELAYVIDLDTNTTTITDSQGTATETNSGSLSTILNNLLSDNNVYGVEFDFGVFEDLMNIIANYSAQDYLQNLALSAWSQNGQISFNVAIDSNEIATLSFDFANWTINAEILDILSISLTKNDGLTLTENATSQVTTNLVDSIVSSMEIENGTYAFSSDIDIRYSTTTFSGTITALLSTSDDENGKTTLTPAISVQTSALGLETYIYLIDNTMYLDINGLQISADLSKNTISDVLAFLEKYFGISLATDDSSDDGSGSSETASALESFAVILPQIDQIYLSWSQSASEIVLELYTPDELWYTASANFSSIIAQFMLDTNTLAPKQIILGANIMDANTTIREDASSYFATYLMDCETSATSALNFAVYLSDVKVGSSADASMFAVANGSSLSANNITAVQTGVKTVTDAETGETSEVIVTTSLDDFNDYSVLLSLVETLMNYVYGYEYQVSLDANISTASSDTSISGDVIAMLVENTESEEVSAASEADDPNTTEETTISDYMSAFEQFKLQASLSIGTGSTTHNVDLLYEDDDSDEVSDDGLYLTYAHGSYIGASAFRGYIEQAGMSDIVSMILAFAGVDLGESMTSMLELSECDTNFTFIRALLGLGSEDVSDDIAKVDGILGSVSGILSMLDSLSISTTTDEGGNVTSTTLTLKIDMQSVNASEDSEEIEPQIATIILVMGKDAPISLSIEDLVYGSMTIDLTLDFETYDSSNFNYDKTEEHFDLSSIADFLDIAVETINTQNFNFSGNAVIDIPSLSSLLSVFGSSSTIEVSIDLYASISDEGEIYAYIELDVPSKAFMSYGSGGGTYTTSSYDKRFSILEFYYNDELETYCLSLYRLTYSDYQSGTLIEDPLEKEWTLADLGSEIMEVLAYTIGLSDTAYSALESLTLNPDFSLEETLLDFSAGDNAYSMTLDGETLSGSSYIGDIGLTVGLSDAYSFTSDTFSKDYRFIDSITTNEISILSGLLTLQLTLNSVSVSDEDYYITGAGATLYTNEYYRYAYIHQLKSLSFETNGGAVISKQFEPAGSDVMLPVPVKLAEDVDGYHIEYEFTGWYLDENCTTLATYDDDMVMTMPDSNTTLYAGWEPTSYQYHTITYVTYDDNEIESLYSYKGNTITLTNPGAKQVSQSNGDGSYTTVSYAFVGWCYYVDGKLVQFDYDENMQATMPSEDITLYALYSEDGEEGVTTYPVYVYRYVNGELKTYTKMFEEDEEIDLSGLGFDSSAKYYENYDSSTNTYSSEVDPSTLTMGTSAIELYVVFEYSVTYKYSYVDEDGISHEVTLTANNTTTTYYQSESLGDMPEVDVDWYADIYSNGILYSRETYYVFVGWYDEDGNLFTSSSQMTDCDLTLTAVFKTEILYYRTIYFDVSWTVPTYTVFGTKYEYSGTVQSYPDSVSSVTVDSTTKKTTSVSTYVTSLQVLQGSVIKLGSISTPVCVFRCKPVRTTYDYTYKALAWNVGSNANVVNVNDSGYDGYESSSYTIGCDSTDSITFAAVWVQFDKVEV